MAGRMHPYLALLLHRDYFRRSDASLSSSFVPQGLFPPSGFISILLFCSTGIISAVRIHLYLAFLFHRDYFAPAGCISILLFCFTGIISADRMHLYLALLLHRDYFRRSDSSPACFFAPQGLFCSGRMHLYLPLLLHRDYFHRPDASLSSSFASQGLFRPAECISILLFSSTGIISAGRIHLYLPLLLHRDYFDRPDASLSSSFAPQGLFPAAECISIFLFCPTGIISASRIHPCLPLLFHRDYFCRPDASPACSFSTGIISTGRIHPQLALFFHRDYFGQPNASLIRAPVKYQQPNFYYTGNTRMASADTLCKKLPQDRQK